MRGVRGQAMDPGQFRTTQNCIGPPGSSLENATYVPPPPSELLNCLADWESFLHEDLRLPPLLRCALMHYQFEAIHPFLDGNGRVGRLLLILFLCSVGRLAAPVLYLSPFFEAHRQEYYDLLRGVTERSDWDAWLTFFLHGVTQQCRDAFLRVDRLSHLHDDYRLLGHRAPPSALSLLEELFLSPATTAKQAADRLHVTVVSASRAIQALCDLGMLTEVTGRKRDRLYLAEGLIEAIDADTGARDAITNQPTLF